LEAEAEVSSMAEIAQERRSPTADEAVPVQGRGRQPEWLKVRATQGPNYRRTKELLRGALLHSVCEEAHCPNIFECFERLTATFLILGRICTWNCRYCAVTPGRPSGVDWQEPQRLAETVRSLGLRFVVITSVTRDDLPDGGSQIFAASIRKIRELVPGCRIEVLTPDFKGRRESIATVVTARPDIYNHNIETVKSIFHRARPKGDYARSLALLRTVKELDPTMPTKSGFMVGLGETMSEIEETMGELKEAGVSIVTAGQYLRPSLKHMPVSRYYRPEEYEGIKAIGRRLGIGHVEAGPLVRSSYHARDQAAELSPELGQADAGVPVAASALADPLPMARSAR
jgi:lipoyl synthase